MGARGTLFFVHLIVRRRRRACTRRDIFVVHCATESSRARTRRRCALLMCSNAPIIYLKWTYIYLYIYRYITYQTYAERASNANRFEAKTDLRTDCLAVLFSKSRATIIHKVPRLVGVCVCVCGVVLYMFVYKRIIRAHAHWSRLIII